MDFRAHYGYDVKAASDEAAYVETMKSLTVQEQALDNDVNELMRIMKITGRMPEPSSVALYGMDFSEVQSFQEMLHTVIAAQQSFETLPAEVRARFSNDPDRLLAFVADDGNMEEALKLGLLDREKYDARKGAVGKVGGGHAVGEAVQPGQGVSGGSPGGSQGPPAGGPVSGSGGQSTAR